MLGAILRQLKWHTLLEPDGPVPPCVTVLVASLAWACVLLQLELKQLFVALTASLAGPPILQQREKGIVMQE